MAAQMTKSKKAGNKKKAVATTHVTFLIDRSGSMARQHHGVVDGFAEYVREQQEMEGEMTFLAVMFDGVDSHEVVANGPIGTVSPEALADVYQARGMTPLYDATARAIAATDRIVAKSKPDFTVVVVFTDGAENASREHNLASLSALVKEREAAGWTFVYLGETGTHDVYAQADSYGTQPLNTSGYQDAAAAYGSVSASTTALRGMTNATAVAGQSVQAFFTDAEGNQVKLAENPLKDPE